MYQYSEIRTVHLEITAKCNASCPMCARNISGGKVNPRLPLTDLTLSDLQSIFPVPFLRQIKRLYMCGNYGDPVVNAHTLEAFRYFRHINPEIKLDMFTNGSMRAPDWWRELGQTIDRCHFGIDGLSDTHHLYRRGTQWQKIIDNAQAFIAAGGVAVWDFLVFRHNEHQVKDARQLSRELGFSEFNVKKTARFFSNTQVTGKNAHPVLDNEGQVEYHLEKPIGEVFLNRALENEPDIVRQHGSLERYLEQGSIDCKVTREKSIYVSAEGLVFPCCWTANQMYVWYRAPKSTQIWSLIGNRDEISAKIKPLKEIIEGAFFQTVLPEAWKKTTFADGKPSVCAKTCAKTGFDPFRSQFEVRRSEQSH